jgi:hypothetical protein
MYVFCLYMLSLDAVSILEIVENYEVLLCFIFVAFYIFVCMKHVLG